MYRGEQQIWSLSLRVFRLLSSSLLLLPQCFGWYVLQPFSAICRTQEPSWNFEPRPLLNQRGSSVLIPLAITGTSVEYSSIVTCLQSGLNLQPPDDCLLRSLEGSHVRQTPEEVQRTYQPKSCGNNNKDEDNSLKTPNDKNHKASSQKFRQLNRYDHWIMFRYLDLP